MPPINNKLVIIGSGPAGLTAAIYAARAGIQPVVITGYTPGGQLTTTTVVENFPGFPEGIDGSQLMANMTTQATKFGTTLVNDQVDAITKLESGGFQLSLHSGNSVTATTVIIATGATPKRINIPGESEYWAKGVSTCATCDGFLFRGKKVAVIGGGDSAMEEALFLANHVAELTIIHRRDQFRASKIMQDRVQANPKIKVIWNTGVTEVLGDGIKVNGLKLKDLVSNQESTLEVQGMFLAIGHTPVTSFLPSDVKLTELGYIESANGINTNIEGLFCAGDVQDHLFRQAVTAAGMGAASALTAQKWLELNANT